jgi:NADH-quinone oxidoreductase subunit J
MGALGFWVLAFVAVVASVLVVGQRNPMYSVLLLIASFGALSGLYILLDAPFVAAIQIIIYAGAIMVLFLFVVMLLNVPTEDPVKGYHARIIGGAGPRHFGAVLAAVLAVELAVALFKLQSEPFPAATAGASSVYAIGVTLFRDYAFAFEATSVLILVAMVGAVILARKESSHETGTETKAEIESARTRES